MPFKKNSPGCVCCASGFTVGGPVFVSFIDAYRFNNLGNITSVINMDSVFGTAVTPIGYDIERKYILAQKDSNREVWLYNVSNGSSAGKLWESTADIATSDNHAQLICYIHSWGFAYGLTADDVANRDNVTVYDSDGNHFHGPYWIGSTSGAGGLPWNLSNFTITSNGDIYATGTQSGGLSNNDYRVSPIVDGHHEKPIYVNDDIAYPRGTIGGTNHTFKLSEPSYTNRVNEAVLNVTCIFSDGTDVYLSVPSQSNGAGQSIEEGIYVIDQPGEKADRLCSHSEMTGDSNNVFRPLQYNAAESRWEGGVYANDPNTLGIVQRMIWTSLEAGKYLILSVANFHLEDNLYGILQPLNIESTWDDL